MGCLYMYLYTFGLTPFDYEYKRRMNKIEMFIYLKLNHNKTTKTKKNEKNEKNEKQTKTMMDFATIFNVFMFLCVLYLMYQNFMLNINVECLRSEFYRARKELNIEIIDLKGEIFDLDRAVFQLNYDKSIAEEYEEEKREEEKREEKKREEKKRKEAAKH